MVGEFLERILVLLLGYAYPAFECFKTLERNDLQMHQLRFWCQYWVIVAFLTVFETFTDALLSWLPVYSEVKLALFIYLWYPQTRGSSYIYERILQPYVIKHEPEFEEKLKILRAKTADLLVFYLKNFTSKGQSMVLDVLQFVTSSQSPRLTGKEELGSSEAVELFPGDIFRDAFLTGNSTATADNHVRRKREKGPTKRRWYHS